MNLLKLWGMLDDLKERTGDLTRQKVEQLLQNHGPTALQAIKQVESGQASKEEFKRASHFFPYFMKHEDYERTIRLYDQSVDFPTHDRSISTFIGRGGGGASLASYRRIKAVHNNGDLFEKIYFNDSPGFRRMLWFYNYIFPQITEKASIPELILIKSGNKFTAVYYRFFDNLRSFYEVCENGDVGGLMAKSYNTLSAQFQQVTLPEMTNQEIVFMPIINTYRRGRSCALKFLRDYNVSERELDGVESRILLHSRDNWTFGHGDLSTDNFYANCLLDFDNCGWYPPGFDLALMLSLVCEFNTLEELRQQASVVNNLNISIPYNKRSFHFFCFVFYSRRVRGVNASNAFLESLWKASLDSGL